MKFWDDGQTESTRIRNVNFAWSELKNLNYFLLEKGITVESTLYDFSPEKIISDSQHIPYPLSVYKKAEKTNLILNQKKNFKFFMMMDCDAFFYRKDYNNLLEIIKNLKDGDVYTFDLAKLDNNISDYIVDGVFIPENADWSFAYSGDKSKGPLCGLNGGLGGVYISDTNLLLSLGGFDESYLGWGGEDGDMLGRIYYSNINHSINPVRNFAPFHLPHFVDWNNDNYRIRH